MRLLIITQKVDKNDDILGFFHRWILEFAKHYEFVTVIALQVGEYDLPKNVKILSLRKEKSVKRSFLVRLKYILNFYKYIWHERKNYDAVFVHMNPIYVVLGGLFWRLWNKKIGLWYAHGRVSTTLYIADILSHIIFTSTKSGYRINSKKIYIVGQGIDTNIFVPVNEKKGQGIFKIISIGRISPIKDYETLIKAVEILVKIGMRLEVDIIGGVGLPEQEQYLSNLKNIVKDRELDGVVHFKNAVPNKDIVTLLQKSDLFVNASHTGSLDKAMLEAMAVGLPVLTCNEAMQEILGSYHEKLMYPKKDTKTLAEKITFITNLNKEERDKMSVDMRGIVVKGHNLHRFISKILEQY